MEKKKEVIRETIQLEPEQLRKLQLEILDVLIEFDRICRKYEIPYFLCGGTLLGAVRHQGFIPWDDDGDVEMLRDDYERFCNVCETELEGSNFFFQSFKNDPSYDWPFGKLRKKNTKYIRTGQEHLKQRTGICIDIFPLDSVNESIVMQKINYIGTKFCRKALWAKVGCRIEKNWFKRMILSLLKRLERNSIITLFDRIVSFCGGDEKSSLLCFNVTESGSERGYTFKKDWYASTVEVEFEGRKFFIPQGYKEILYYWYDDYMQLPPTENRLLSAIATNIVFSDGTELIGKGILK